jgi:hypothetical protein
MDNPSEKNVIQINRIVKYLNGTINFELQYKKGNEGFKEMKIDIFTHADLRGIIKTNNQENRHDGMGRKKIDKRSTTGHEIMFEKSVVGFRSKRQTSTPKSGTEAETLAISMTLGD